MTDERAVTTAYGIMCRDNRTFAKFNNVGLDSAGHPDQTDLHLAWAAGARAFRLTPRVTCRGPGAGTSYACNR